MGRFAAEPYFGASEVEKKIKTKQASKKRLRMKTEKLKITLACLVASLMAVGAQQGRAATDEKPTVMVTLNQLNSELHILRENLSRAKGTLEQVKAAANNNDDLSKSFAAYSSAYGELEAQVAKVRQYGTAAKARAKEHWEAWQKELTDMQNPKLREKAQKRFTTTQSEFEKIVEKVGEAKEAFAPLAADLKDINTYLATDLSKDAVSSLSGTIWKMGNAAHSVDGKLEDVNKQIERAMNKLPK
jgi:chromosome segregation ATPase